MGSDGSKSLGDWGKMTPVSSDDDSNVHITQTNENSNDGTGAHVTTQVGDVSVHDYFDQDGNYNGSDYSDNG